MIVAVVGSRQGVNLDVVEAFVRGLHAKHPGATVISGGAMGVDTVAEVTAWELGHEIVSLRPVEVVPEGEGGVTAIYAIERWLCAPGGDLWEDTSADYGEWTSYAAAAKARNSLVVDAADVVVAFTAGSNGTAHTISEARRLGKPFHVYGPQGAPL